MAGLLGWGSDCWNASNNYKIALEHVWNMPQVGFKCVIPDCACFKAQTDYQTPKLKFE